MQTFWITVLLVGTIAFLIGELAASWRRERELRQKVERYETERRAWAARTIR